MRRILLAAMLIAGAPSVASAQVTIDMPPPPKSTEPVATDEYLSGVFDESAEEPKPTVGAVALARYSRARVAPRVEASAWFDGGYGWGGYGWGGYGWGGYGWGGYGWGGYRISLSPWTFFGSRGWNGGYVYPPFLYGPGYYGRSFSGFGYGFGVNRGAGFRGRGFGRGTGRGMGMRSGGGMRGRR